MSRRTRRRLYVVAFAALVGAGSPLWGPPLLRSLPAFRVERVEVVGTRHVPPDEVVRRADLAPRASVWDDPEKWTLRVEEHPLVRDVRVRRLGWSRLEFEVEEVEPVALVPTPTLRPVDERGRLLPLDAARQSLDLPVLPGPVEVDSGRIRGERVEDALAAVVALRRYDPGFVAQVSDLRVLPRRALEVRMVEAAPADRILLPASRLVPALRRVEVALGERGGSVGTVDARYRGQVVLRAGEGRDR